jgi:ankyrin repeat protein
LQHHYANLQDANGKTALCRAAEKNHIQSVKLLLLHVDNDQWETTLVSAVKSGNRVILNIILDACNHQLILNIPILHLACKLNNGRRIAEQPFMMTEAIVSTDEDYITAYLVENLHLNILSDYNKEGYTPILLAARFGFVDCVKYLLSTSKNVEQQLEEHTKDHEYNIFHVCVQHERRYTLKNSTDSGHFAICKFIFEDHKYKHIANRLLCEQDNEGNTPLHLACKHGNIRICELFVNHMGENTYLFVEDLKQRTPLHVCAKFGNHALVKILLPDTIDKKVAVQALNDTKGMDGRTPLHLACIEGESHFTEKTINFILPNEEYYLISLGNMEVIKCFIEEFNASLLIQADNLDTPFFSACEYGHLNVVNYFLDMTNAVSTIRNSKGLNALDVAIMNHREKVVQRLLSCDNWRRLMENAYYDDSGIISTPMRELIIFMPEIAYEIVDTKLTSIKGSDDMTEHQVIYDYTFFEDQYHIRDWMYGE